MGGEAPGDFPVWREGGRCKLGILGGARKGETEGKKEGVFTREDHLRGAVTRGRGRTFCVTVRGIEASNVDREIGRVKNLW